MGINIAGLGLDKIQKGTDVPSLNGADSTKCSQPQQLSQKPTQIGDMLSNFSSGQQKPDMNFDM